MIKIVFCFLYVSTISLYEFFFRYLLKNKSENEAEKIILVFYISPQLVCVIFSRYSFKK
jgi:hypothetical protein